MLQIVKPRQVTKLPKVSVSCLLNATITLITHLGPRLCGPETELVSIIIFQASGFSPDPGVCQGPRSPFFLVHSISQQSRLPKKPRAKYKLTSKVEKFWWALSWLMFRTASTCYMLWNVSTLVQFKFPYFVVPLCTSNNPGFALSSLIFRRSTYQSLSLA